MRTAVSDAKGRFIELVRRAEAGDAIILTRRGQAAVRLVPVNPAKDPATRRAIMEALQEGIACRLRAGTDAARSQDFLYDGDGLPA